MAISFADTELFCSSCASNDLVFFTDGLFTDIAGSASETGVICQRCGHMYSKEFIEANLHDFSSEERREELIYSRKIKSEHYRKMDAEQEKLEMENEEIRLKRQAKAIEKVKSEASQQKLWKESA